ncbi:MAG TPA: hypothetical protein PKV41_04025 [Candidatus Omnitrophota bacterium]|nr:hypothetical protein [Candidatus Omnitrophota bacterium]
MDNTRYHFRKGFLVFTCCLCLAALFLEGCTPLRKKFTREKKDDGTQSQKDLPILEPVDYPEKTVLPLEKYKYHYSLWKIWDRDLLQAVDRDGSEKRQKYLLEQAVAQLEEMKKILIDEKQAEFSVLVDDLRGVQEMVEKPSPNVFSIKMRIERNASKIRNGFAPDPALLVNGL